MDLDVIISKLKSYTPEKIEEKLLSLIKDHEAEIVDLNTIQLMNGLDAKGKSLGEYSSKSYAEFKRRLNPKGVVDLRLEQDFHDSIFLETDKFPVYSNATDSKTGDLIKKYGEDILDTPEKDKEVVSEIIKPDTISFFQTEVFNL